MHVIHVDANKVFDALLSHYETISAIASIVVLPWSFFIVSEQKYVLENKGHYKRGMLLKRCL